MSGQLLLSLLWEPGEVGGAPALRAKGDAREQVSRLLVQRDGRAHHSRAVHGDGARQALAANEVVLTQEHLVRRQRALPAAGRPDTTAPVHGCGGRLGRHGHIDEGGEDERLVLLHRRPAPHVKHLWAKVAQQPEHGSPVGVHQPVQVAIEARGVGHLIDRARVSPQRFVERPHGFGSRVQLGIRPAARLVQHGRVGRRHAAHEAAGHVGRPLCRRLGSAAQEGVRQRGVRLAPSLEGGSGPLHSEERDRERVARQPRGARQLHQHRLHHGVEPRVCDVLE
mmetsp:Transcript_28770/g.91833  ORF Transcript_28770/g.91833 Transcript_28770/m.91833 type:complete len:281 (+) Transcript_28770:1495-2337(+)